MMFFGSNLVVSLIHALPFLMYLSDGGGVYAETNPENIIVEPWNAITSLFLIAPAVYLFHKLNGEYRRHPFLLYCIPLLTLGGLGSTLFHAFRTSPFFLYLDVIPTLLLTLSISAYFWYRVVKNGWIVALIIGGSMALRYWLFLAVDPALALNLSYFITGVTIFVPTLLILLATDFQQSQLILLAALLLGVSLLFRRLDTELAHILPMGTHFLWHIFSAVGALFLAKYLYFLDRRRVSLEASWKQ